MAGIDCGYAKLNRMAHDRKKAVFPYYRQKKIIKHYKKDIVRNIFRLAFLSFAGFARNNFYRENFQMKSWTGKNNGLSGGILALALVFSGCANNNNNVPAESSETQTLIKTDEMKNYVSFFNELDEEDVVNYIPNAQAYEWMEANVPLFECPDSAIEQTYYYRWWTFRKHLKETPDGFVFTEFILPVGHAGKYNTVSCALGHQVYEGRWLHNPEYINEYIAFWLIKDKNEPDPKAHKFSSWLADAVYSLYLVNHDEPFTIALTNELVNDYQQWYQEKGLPDGMYWQYDVRDGMEESISGSRTEKNARPTINSYMYANALAIAKIASMANNDSLQQVFEQKAAELKRLTQENLWDEEANFFKVQFEDETLSDAREAIGYIPWYFNLPDDKEEYGIAWEQIKDPEGFLAPVGLTTAEQRHPEFRTHGTGTCEWDGAVWPFATTQTLKGLANLLNNYDNHSMAKEDYFDAFKTYAVSHEKNGKPFIGEYHDEKTGKWLKDKPRSRYYNHSGFCDLVINDLVGLKPQQDNTIEVKPLIPEGTWDWFCLDQVQYHGRMLTILWDKTGEKYGRGKGFSILADGVEIAQSDQLENISGKLPEAVM